MAKASAHPVLRYIRRLAASQPDVQLPDAKLLERFAADRDEGAFAILVGRHGPLVLSACVRVLGDPHAAEDAFQATFLVLARKASLLKRPEALGAWLFGVATRTALKLRTRQNRCRQVEEVAAVGPAVEGQDEMVWRDLRPVLDEAIADLAELYRVPFVLHHLEGATVAEVARRLGCPQGTVSARLARAKEKLRTRLSRQGLAFSAATFTAALHGMTATASIPVVLAASVTGAASLVPVASTTLTKGVFAMTTYAKLKIAAALLVACAASAGLGLNWHGTAKSGRASTGTTDVADSESTSGAVADSGRAPAALWPKSERFYAGGFRSVRVFEFRGTRPAASGCERFGDFLFLNSLEYQVPVLDSDKLYCVPFVDCGTVENGGSNKKEYRVSPGCGFRIVVPMLGPVPVALDFGFPVVKAPADREQIFRFRMGFTG